MNESEVFQKEVEELEAKLQEKKQMLEASQPTPEKEVFSEVFKEHIDQEVKDNSEFVASSNQDPQNSSKSSNSNADDEKEAQQYIDSLVELSFQKGILSAVKEARKMGNAYVLDKFHDTLVDRYYQKLLDSRQLKQG